MKRHTEDGANGMASEQWTRLQATLRAIERGERLEAIDELLIRQVLQQAPPKRTGAAATEGDVQKVDGSDAYRTLLRLRRQKLKAREAETKAKQSPPKKSVGGGSPAKKTALESLGRPNSPPDERQEDDHREERERREARRELHNTLEKTRQQLERSQYDVVEAAAEMETLMAASQAVLSSTFLFERNLIEFCQQRSLDVIQHVLQRFKHRFYALFFGRWVDTTQRLRRQQQMRAVATIARVFRGHRARNLRRLLMKEQQKLKQQAKRVVELRVTYRVHQALKIQRAWSRYKWRECEKRRARRNLAAIVMQRRWRDSKLQRNVLIAALLNVKQILAAIRIQRIVRGHLARVRIKTERREKQRQETAMKVLLLNTSHEALVQWRIERRGAAFVIGRAMYPVVVRQRFRKMVATIKRERAAMVVSRSVYAWYHNGDSQQAKRRAAIAEKLKLLLEREHSRLDAAAIRIQKNMRRWWLRSQYVVRLRTTRKRARLKRLKEKRERLEKAKAAGTRPIVAAVLGRASAGFAEAMKQAKKKVNNGQKLPVSMEASSAARIQRAYLQHRYQKRFRHKQWRKEAISVEERVRRRQHAAVTIQRYARGMLSRRKLRRLRAEHLLLQYVRRSKWQRATRRSQAAAKLTRWIKAKRAQRMATLWRVEKERQTRMATRLQQWLRWVFFYRRRIGGLLARRRRQEEARTYAAQSLVVCTQRFMDELVLFSSQGSAYDEGIKTYIKDIVSSAAHDQSAKKPPVKAKFAVLPVVFVIVSGMKDTSKWPAFSVKDLLTAKVERTKVITLFRAANQLAARSGTQSPKKKRKQVDMFAMTDVDLAMAKAAGSSKRALIFPEFVTTLQGLADMKLAHITLWWSRYDGSEARLLALVWHYLLPLPELKPLALELMAYATKVLSAHCGVIQRLFVRKRDAARGHLLKLQLLQQRDIEQKRLAIIKVQAAVRRLLAKKVYRRHIQEQYDKYIDPEWGLPYWMNPRTGYSTWMKPHVLRDEDVNNEVVPFPSPDKVLTLACQGKSGCATCSDWYCYSCEESFCTDCMPTFHKPKEGETSHDMEALRKCGLCKFQIASRKCATCLGVLKKAEKARKTPTQAAEALEVESLFCDTCFVFMHRQGTLQVHVSEPLVEMCDDCQNEEELLDDAQAPKVAKPLPRAVQWICTTDKKRVCSICALLLHPIEACGELTKVALVTIQMKMRAEYLAKEQAERDRANVELMRLRELQAKQETASKRIQTFWRNCAPLIRARRVARELRQEKDSNWRQKQLDQAVAKQLKYRIKDAFGYAPPLPSDTAVERKRREMNRLQRRQMAIRARVFGLLVGEYMQLGIPLPGIARVRKGQRFLQCSESLRGWVLNRQTLRLKKLPPKQERDELLLLKRQRGHEIMGNENVWPHDIRHWMRNPSDTILVDIDAKQHISEQSIPLAAAFGTPPPVDQPTTTAKTNTAKQSEDNEEDTETEEYAMFLVEFSMDPARVIWINHSFAERFAVWRKQMVREYQERREFAKGKPLESQDAKSSKPMQPTVHIETPTATDARETIEEPPPQVADPYYAGYDQSGWENSSAMNCYGYSSSSYYTENAWAKTSTSPYYYPSTGYDSNASSSYSTQYAAGATQSQFEPALVDSSTYFYADDGNTAAWDVYYAQLPGMASQSYDSEQATSFDAHYSGDYSDQTNRPDAWGSTAASSQSNAAPSTSLHPWEEVFDPATQRAYYYNHETHETSWEYPSAS